MENTKTPIRPEDTTQNDSRILKVQRTLKRGDNVPVTVFYSSDMRPEPK